MIKIKEIKFFLNNSLKKMSNSDNNDLISADIEEFLDILSVIY